MARRRKAQEIITGYRGPFSSYPEWHAFGTGFHYGANTNYGKIPDDLFNPDAPRFHEDVVLESHYAYFGFDVGDVYRRHRRKVHGLVGTVLTVATAHIAGVL